MSYCWAGLGAIGDPPLRIGTDECSMSAGIIAYSGVMAALWRRWLTGRGDAIEVSLLGSICAVKGQHWTALSNPDDWPGLHLRFLTDPPETGWQTADLPVIFNFGWGRSVVDQPSRAPDIAAALGAAIPGGMDIEALAGAEEGPTSPRWKPFWEELFRPHTWEQLGAIFAAHVAELTPFTDYPTLDHHPQTRALGIFAPMTVDGHEVRVVRVPWRLGGYPDGFEYRAPHSFESTAGAGKIGGGRG